MRTIRNNEKITDLQTPTSLMIGDYTGFYYMNDIGNCKNVYISNIGDLINAERYREATLKRLDELFLKVRNLTFSCNVTSKIAIDKLSKHFQLISVQEIGTGYSNGIQYHAVFFTNYKEYGSRDKYIANVNNLKKQKEKSKSLNIAEAQIEKIVSYTSRTWLKKYLQTLIS